MVFLEEGLVVASCLMFGPLDTFVSLNIILDFGFTVLAAEVVKVLLKPSGVVGGVSILLVTLFVSSPLHTSLIMKETSVVIISLHYI